MGFDTTYTAQTSGGSIMDYLMTIGAACDLGFRVRLAGKNADKELTREVRLHNNFAQRVPVIEEQLKVANHRIADLEEHEYERERN